MARFQLRNEAKSWFSQISGKEPFKVDFDLYYLCLMAGFASGRSSDSTASTEMVDYFVEEYKPAASFLIGLLVIAELKKGRVDVTERAAVRTLFKHLVDPQSKNQLTDFGVKRMNAYASGGYEYLAEQRDYKPYSAEAFLRDYAQLLNEAAEKI